MDIFDNFNWHSSIGIDQSLADNKKFVTRLPATKKAMTFFASIGDGSLLIHKTSKALWRMADDGKGNSYIEPVYASDCLTQQEVAEAMKEN